MDLERILTQYNAEGGTGLQMPDITSSITAALLPFILALSIPMVLFAIFYIVTAVRRWKVEKAIFDIQKNVREINERERNRAEGLPLKPPVLLAQEPAAQPSEPTPSPPPSETA